jgi:type IV pilus assembly protein PilY1
LTSPHAGAQADLNPPLPNVLLLVDTSGSMEYKIDGTPVTCNPGNTANVNDKSRWTNLVEVLTGTIDNYSCQTINRLDSGVGFRTGEYAWAGDPYDFRYPIPYHRPLANGCAAGPGIQNTNPFIYPTAGGINYHNYSGSGACTFSQPGNDGVLDNFQDSVRFALMTFDTSPDPGTGFDGQMLSATINPTTGKKGLWSYVVGNSAQGMPAGCTTGPKDEEVGARNAAAPPWEGRMVNFGNPNDGVRDYVNKNKHIQEILLATRPYGATPIAGMLHDAEDFLLNDTSKDPDRNPSSLDPNDVASDFGPHADPYLDPSCGRQEVIILLTDGQPNMDLRPFCDSKAELPAGICPFDKPEDIVARLDSVTTQHKNQIPTYVVGFALDKVDLDNDPTTPPIDCDTLNPADPAGPCSNPQYASNQALQACCTLQRIAIAGGDKTSTDPNTNQTVTTTRKCVVPGQACGALYANSAETLRSQLSLILTAQQKASSRSVPVQASAGQSGSSTNPMGAFRFYTGFDTAQLQPWSGEIQRQRILCEQDQTTNLMQPSPKVIDPTSGDDFVHNVAKFGPDARYVFTVLGGNSSADPITPLESIRPNIGSTDPDGVGIYGGRSLSGNSSTFIANMPIEALAIPTTSCIDQNGKALGTPNACRDLYLKWWLGYDNGQSTVIPRCKSPGDKSTCQIVGDVMHSTPAVIDHPTASIRDESYARFEFLQATRPMMLYVSTNDGLLHAFKVTSNNKDDFADDSKMVRNDSQSNELWTFAPPAVLPNLYHLYPYSHQLLLDGTPTYQDVVAVQPTQVGQPPTVFERTAADAQAGAAAWRTVLLQGFGSQHSGYFAVDVTSPELNPSAPDDPTQGGPRMLWQLTRDANGANLFGHGGVTPLIATLFFDPTGGSAAKEIPVAILPGGPGGTQVTTGPGCPAGGRTYTDVSIDPDYPPRPRVHCYSFPNDEIGARSLTIVRLDTGEIIRTFRQSKTEVSTTLQARTTEANLDAPITGQPVAYPGFVGQTSDRIYVGDADGRLFKVDVSATDPSKWTMKLFFDLYPTNEKATGVTNNFDSGQPVMLPPTLSVDDSNNVVVDVAAGDQQTLGPSSYTNNVYSLTDSVDLTSGTTSTKVNWYLPFTQGKRVVGPMVLFNTLLYFAAYQPPSAGGSVCAQGQSFIYQADYLNPATKSPSPDSSSGPAQFAQLNSFFAVTAGVSAEQDPSCSTVDDIPGDLILGFGHELAMSQINTGAFKLVFHTGNQKGTGDNTGAAMGVGTVTLTPPPTISSIESWASIVE